MDSSMIAALIANGTIGGCNRRSTPKTFTASLTSEQTKQIVDALESGKNVKINIELE